ncbi:MAG: di-trans,poly-cis-decaprenylcistransferase, partial [Verrucomicrobia bacterium]|nr:di-trans,poly-cis-decaprenylcistransferase [Verrucomicrobiota bacterium]
MSTTVPRHVAVIMDGNGRWARQRDWPRTRGHLEGANAAKDCVEACLELGIEYLTLYTFSTENWRRPKEEVETLMGLLQKFLRDYTDELRDRSVRLEAIGRLNEMPAAVYKQVMESIAATADGKRLTTILALNYSGRAEIVDAV